MSKIVLRNVQLINWYGFTNTVVPVAENLTLISGEMSAENRRSSMPSNMPTPVIRSLIRRQADIIQAWASEI